MPNWCNNYANFICPSKEIYDKLLESIKNNTWFQTFAPLGLDLLEYPDGWDFGKACLIWKTKWSPSEVIINDEDEFNCTLNVSFESAWSPPTGVYSLMSKNYNIDVIAYYDEPGNCFFGRCMYANNEREQLEVDDTYDFPSDEIELEELRKIIGIGSDLDDYMNCEWLNLQEMWKEESENVEACDYEYEEEDVE
jgi:hypothetical protein